MLTNAIVVNVRDILTAFMNADEVINCYVRQSNVQSGDFKMDRDQFYQIEIEGVIVDCFIFEHKEAIQMRDRLIEKEVYAARDIRIRPYTYAPRRDGAGKREPSEVLAWTIGR